MHLDMKQLSVIILPFNYLTSLTLVRDFIFVSVVILLGLAFIPLSHASLCGSSKILT